MKNNIYAALGLKHGGHERVLDKLGYLKAPKKCTFREDGNWIVLKSGKTEMRYPRPENIVTLGKDSFEEGESICCAYTTSSPISKLNSLVTLLAATGNSGKRYFEKDDIIISDCYAFEDGVIRYVETQDGEMNVIIGDHTYLYEPRCMYYFPDGAKVKKFDRICSGVVNMSHVTSALGTNLNDIYQIFRKQFYTLTSKNFLKKGVSELDDPQEELIELLFSGLIRKTYDPDSMQLEEIEYLGTRRGTSSKKSFYTILSYGAASQVVSKALKGEVNLSGDVIILKLSKNLIKYELW